MKRICVSIDLDPIDCYYAIHGLGEPPADLACSKGFERFLSFAQKHGFPVTVFVVGKELGRPDFSELVRNAALIGHEIANHSFSHRYDLSRLSADETGIEIIRGHDAIAGITGVAPAGFRAPGYNISSNIIRTLEGTGYIYDSSAFPSHSYWFAKSASMILSRFSGRKSSALVNPISSLLSPSGPYHPDPDKPYSRGQAGLIEFPISLTPVLRIPMTGTFFLLADGLLERHLVSSAESAGFLNLEFHGIDFLDKTEVGEGLLKAGQPDARMGLDEKLEKFDRLFEHFKDREFLTLSEAAGNFNRN